MKYNVIEENDKILKYMLITVIIIIFLYCIYSFFIIQSNLDSLEENLETNLQEISKKQAEVIKEKIEFNIKEIEIIKDLYSEIEGYNLEEEINKFNSVSDNDMTINYSDINGNILIGGENNLPIGGTEFYKFAIRGEEYLTKQTSLNWENYLVYSAPLEKDNEIKGVIIAWIDINILDEIINNTIFDELGYFSLLGQDKTIILDKNKEFINENMLQLLERENSSELVNEVKNIIEQDSKKAVKVNMSGNEKYLNVTRIDDYNTNIYLLSFVESSYISKEIQKIGRDLYIALLVTLSILIFGSLYIIRQKRGYITKVNKIAYLDNLTGGYNLNYLYMKVPKTLEKDKLYVISYIEIKRFSNISDIFGMEVSQNLVLKLYNTLEKLIEEKKYIIHLEESKFIVLQEYVNKENIKSKLFDINEEVVKYIERNKINIKTNISAGIVYSVKSEELEKNVNNANMSKVLIHEDMSTIIKEYDDITIKNEKEKIEIEREIKEALENNYFVAYYQPKKDSRSKKIIGAEALVRIKHPEKGLIMPGRFISIAEKTKYISLIDRKIFEIVCRDLKLLKEMGKKLVPISINLSRSELFNSTLINFIEETVEKYGVNRENIEFEITESEAIDNVEIFSQILKELKGKGYQIMLDDFGSGYSSYTSILDMPIDVLKIDKSFIDTILLDKKHEQVVQNIIELCKVLNISVLAEGVELEEQVQKLAELRCYNIQGYVYHKPINFENFKEILENNKSES